MSLPSFTTAYESFKARGRSGYQTFTQKNWFCPKQNGALSKKSRFFTLQLHHHEFFHIPYMFEKILHPTWMAHPSPMDEWPVHPIHGPMGDPPLEARETLSWAKAALMPRNSTFAAVAARGSRETSETSAWPWRSRNQ